MQSNHLIGTSNWDPYGESMWSIINKIAYINGMDWIEIRRNFGKFGLQSFNKIHNATADIQENFSLTQIAKITGWTREDLLASFSNFYMPSNMISEYEDESHVDLYNEIRMCPQCYKDGIHLTLHQFKDLKYCPIHGCELTTKCPSCGEPFPIYSISNSYKNPKHCQCHTFIHNFKKNKETHNNNNIRRDLITEFKQWVKSIEQHFCSDEATYKWFNFKRKFIQLAYAHQFIHGPNWLNNCLVNATSITHYEKLYDKYHLEHPPNDLNYTLKKSTETYGHGSFSKDELFYTLSPIKNEIHKLGLKIHKISEYLKKTFVEPYRHHSGFKKLNADEFYLQYGFGITSWSTGFSLWRQSVKNDFDEYESWNSKRRYYRDSMTESYIWDEWVQGPGSLLWSQYDNYIKFFNIDFVDKFSNYWIKNHFLELYFMYVGLACLKIIDCQRLSNYHIDGLLPEVGELPAWFIEETNNGVIVHYLSMNEKKAKFYELMKSGFEGAGEDFMTNKHACDALFQLLHIHPYRLQQWYNNWDKLYADSDGGHSRIRLR